MLIVANVCCGADLALGPSVGAVLLCRYPYRCFQECWRLDGALLWLIDTASSAGDVFCLRRICTVYARSCDFRLFPMQCQSVSQFPNGCSARWKASSMAAMSCHLAIWPSTRGPCAGCQSTLCRSVLRMRRSIWSSCPTMSSLLVSCMRMVPGSTTSRSLPGSVSDRGGHLLPLMLMVMWSRSRMAGHPLGPTASTPWSCGAHCWLFSRRSPLPQFAWIACPCGQGR